jgi:hypothetical protein
MQEQARENLRGLVLISPLSLGLERVPCRETLSSSSVLSKSVGDSPACAYSHYRKWPETVAQRYRCSSPLRPVSTYLDSCNRFNRLAINTPFTARPRITSK